MPIFLLFIYLSAVCFIILPENCKTWLHFQRHTCVLVSVHNSHDWTGSWPFFAHSSQARKVEEKTGDDYWPWRLQEVPRSPFDLWPKPHGALRDTLVKPRDSDPLQCLQLNSQFLKANKTDVKTFLLARNGHLQVFCRSGVPEIILCAV